MKVLLLAPLDNYVDDINCCNSYNSVMAFFLKKYLKKYDVDVELIPVADSFTRKQISKSNFRTFKKLILDTNLLETFDKIIILGIKSLRSIHPKVLEEILKCKDKIFELDETAKRRSEDFTTLFMVGDEEYTNAKFIGQGVDLDFLYPEQSHKELVIHVDHPWYTGVHYFDLIYEKNLQLIKEEIFKKYGFESVKFIYHTEEIEDISKINSLTNPQNVSFLKLSEIYRKTHVGFISHPESMGNYPLELAACGAVVVLPNNNAIPGFIKNQINWVSIGQENFWDYIFLNLDEIQKSNQQKAIKFSYDAVVERIINIIK